jgi:NAD(P)-dependent dehydrogenase (short-subunit alcohol dehydrogenase family)
LGGSYRALVIGSTGAIGSAFVRALQQDPACQQVHALSRHTHPGFDLEDEASMAQAAAELAQFAPFHLMVDATGALTFGAQGPEKSLQALHAPHMLKNMAVNAVGPTLLFKHLMPLLDTQQRTVYAKLSARVGSIGDNHKGGWYSYRASKAALNMLLQTAAIEANRKRPMLVVAALQPGTVASALSQPFVASGALQPDTSVSGLLKTLDGLPAIAGAHFVDYQGVPIPW